MKTTILALLLALATAILAVPTEAPAEAPVKAAAQGESHSGVRFSAIADYPNTRITNNYGACASTGPDPRYLENDPTSMMVALDANVPNWAAYCGKRIRLTNPDGRTCEATIVDKCPGCGAQGGEWSLDLLEGPWNAVGGQTSAHNVYGASWEVIG